MAERPTRDEVIEALKALDWVDNVRLEDAAPAPYARIHVVPKDEDSDEFYSTICVEECPSGVYLTVTQECDDRRCCGQRYCWSMALDREVLGRLTDEVLWMQERLDEDHAEAAEARRRMR